MEEFQTSDWQFEPELLIEKPRPISYRWFFLYNLEDGLGCVLTAFGSLLSVWHVVSRLNLFSFFIFIFFISIFLSIFLPFRRECLAHKYLVQYGEAVCGKVEKQSFTTLLVWDMRELQPFVGYVYDGM